MGGKGYYPRAGRPDLAETLRPCAVEVAKLLAECGSENEFRLRCVAKNVDPDDFFVPYGDYVAEVSGYTKLGLANPEFTLSKWWAFEKIPGARKPDPWLTGRFGKLGP